MKIVYVSDIMIELPSLVIIKFNRDDIIFRSNFFKACECGQVTVLGKPYTSELYHYEYSPTGDKNGDWTWFPVSNLIVDYIKNNYRMNDDDEDVIFHMDKILQLLPELKMGLI